MQISGCLEIGSGAVQGGERILKRHEKTSGLMNMFIILTVAMVSWVCILM